MKDRIQVAYEMRCRIHRHIIACPSSKMEAILDAFWQMSPDTVRKSVAWLRLKGHIQMSGRSTAARYTAITMTIDPTETGRENLRTNASGANKFAPAQKQRLTASLKTSLHDNEKEEEKNTKSGYIKPGHYRNYAGSLPRGNSGGQGAVRQPTTIKCSRC
jgi:hypothetical protein